MQGQHSSESAGTRMEYLHGSASERAVLGDEQHQTSHEPGPLQDHAMTFLIATEIPAGQAVAEQRGLPESKAETFSSYRIHSARRVAH